MMTHREIARVLCISRQQVILDEKRAIAKIAVALDLPLPELPNWMIRQWAKNGVDPLGIGKRRCGRCGELGHNLRGCVA